MQLVQRVSADPQAKEKSQERPGEDQGVDLGGNGRADDDVGQVPGGVGGMQERQEVARHAPGRGVEGGAFHGPKFMVVGPRPLSPRPGTAWSP